MDEQLRATEFAGRIVEGMDVCDISGEKIGTVSRVHQRTGGATEDRVIEVKTGFLGLGSHLWIPITMIQDMTADCLFLDVSKDVAQGWTTPRAPG